MLENIIKNKVAYLHGAIVLLLTFGIGFLPPVGEITPYGMKVLGVFVGLVYGWVFCGMAWPSLFAMVMLAFTGYGTVEAIFGEGFSNSSVQLILWVFILVAFWDSTGFTRFVAEWSVSRKICVGKPWIFTTIIMLVAVFLAAFTNGFATLAVCWSLGFKSCEVLGYKKDDKYVIVLLAGITLMVCMSSTIMPFRTTAVLINNLMKSGIGYGIASADWLIFQLIFTAVTAIVFMLACKYIVKPDTSNFGLGKDIYEDLRNNKMSGPQKWAAAMLILFLFIVILPSFFSKEIPFIAVLNKIGIIGGAALCLVIINFVKDKDGKAIAEIGTICTKGTNWNLILMLVASFPVASAFKSDAAGIVATIMNVVTPVVSNMSPIVFIVSIVVIFGIVTQFTHNLVLMLVFTPVFAQLCLTINFPPELFVIIFATTCCLAMVTPGSSAIGAMMHGNTDWVSGKNIYLSATLTVLLAFAILLLVGLPVGFLIW